MLMGTEVAFAVLSLWTLLVVRKRILLSRASLKSELLRTRKVAKSQSLAHRHDPLIAMQGEGNYLINESGTRFLDSRNNVAIIGHQHPIWLKQVCAQLAKTNTHSRYLHPLRNQLEEALCATLPPSLSVCFLVNSGSEATEIALRLAHAKTKRRAVLAVENGYHGVTNAALACSPYKWTRPPPDLFILPMDGDINNILDTEAKQQSVSCFIVESMQSVGGVRLSSNIHWLSDCFSAVKRWGGVCICDEVQVGLGRTGEWFWAFERDPHCVPDIVTIGKGLGNGFPVAAVVCTQEVAQALDEEEREVFSTFGGNAVACQAALSVLEILQQEGLQARAKHVGEYFRSELLRIQTRHMSLLEEIRGIGMFIGLVFPSSVLALQVSNEMYDRFHVLTSCDDRVMVVKPPLSWTKAEVDVFCHALVHTAVFTH